jgi:hypothetical protein
METRNGGKVLVQAKMENLNDQYDVSQGRLRPDQVRTVTVTEAVVDMGEMLLSLPRRYVERLGLQRYRTRKAQIHPLESGHALREPNVPVDVSGQVVQAVAGGEPLVILVLHQGFEGRNDDRHPGQEQGWQDVALALAAAGRGDAQDAAAAQHPAQDAVLERAHLREAEQAVGDVVDSRLDPLIIAPQEARLRVVSLGLRNDKGLGLPRAEPCRPWAWFKVR